MDGPCPRGFIEWAPAVPSLSGAGGPAPLAPSLPVRPPSDRPRTFETPGGAPRRYLHVLPARCCIFSPPEGAWHPWAARDRLGAYSFEQRLLGPLFPRLYFLFMRLISAGRLALNSSTPRKVPSRPASHDVERTP